jgi:hypothetical protein
MPPDRAVKPTEQGRRREGVFQAMQKRLGMCSPVDRRVRSLHAQSFHGRGFLPAPVRRKHATKELEINMNILTSDGGSPHFVCYHFHWRLLSLFTFS